MVIAVSLSPSRHLAVGTLNCNPPTAIGRTVGVARCDCYGKGSTIAVRSSRSISGLSHGRCPVRPVPSSPSNCGNRCNVFHAAYAAPAMAVRDGHDCGSGGVGRGGAPIGHGGRRAAVEALADGLPNVLPLTEHGGQVARSCRPVTSLRSRVLRGISRAIRGGRVAWSTTTTVIFPPESGTSGRGGIGRSTRSDVCRSAVSGLTIIRCGLAHCSTVATFTEINRPATAAAMTIGRFVIPTICGSDYCRSSGLAALSPPVCTRKRLHCYGRSTAIGGMAGYVSALISQLVRCLYGVSTTDFCRGFRLKHAVGTRLLVNGIDEKWKKHAV